MSSLDFSGLKDLTTNVAGRREWQPLTADMLGYGTVLAFDQSLTATGAVILQHIYPATAPSAIRAEKWSTAWEGKDVTTSLRRGVDVFRQTKHTLRAVPVPIDHVVHESPPNPAAVKGGGYSSLLAAQALWCACDELGIGEPEQIGAQPGKKLVCGNANAKKPVAHDALKKTVLPWIVGSHLITNEAQRDALIVALMKLARIPR